MRVATFCTVMPRKIRIHFSIGMYEHKCILKAKNKQKCLAFKKKTEKSIHFVSAVPRSGLNRERPLLSFKFKQLKYPSIHEFSWVG